MKSYVVERTAAWKDFEREWRRVAGDDPAWPSASNPLCAETLRSDGAGPPLRWSAAKGAEILRAIAPKGAWAAVAALEAGGAAWEPERTEVESAGEELTRLFAEGATYDELASMARSMGLAPCRLRIVAW